MSILSNISLSSLKLEDESVLEQPQAEVVSPEESAEQLAEVQADQVTLENDLQDLSEAEESVETIEQVTQESEELLEDESVTDEQIENQIAVQQEAFALALGKLGYSRKHLAKLKVNTESAGSAREKLKLHIEEDKGFLKKTWENIKKFLKKIWDFVSGMVMKIVNWVKGLFIKKPPEKIDEQLQKEANEVLPKIEEVMEKNKKKDSPKTLLEDSLNKIFSNAREVSNNLTETDKVIKFGSKIADAVYDVGESLDDTNCDDYPSMGIEGVKAQFKYFEDRIKHSYENIAASAEHVLKVIKSNKELNPKLAEGLNIKEQSLVNLERIKREVEEETGKKVIKVIAVGVSGLRRTSYPYIVTVESEKYGEEFAFGTRQESMSDVIKKLKGEGKLKWKEDFPNALYHEIRSDAKKNLNALYGCLIEAQKNWNGTFTKTMNDLKAKIEKLHTDASQATNFAEDKQGELLHVTKQINIIGSAGPKIIASSIMQRSISAFRSTLNLYNLCVEFYGGTGEMKTPKEDLRSK